MKLTSGMIVFILFMLWSGFVAFALTGTSATKAKAEAMMLTYLQEAQPEVKDAAIECRSGDNGLLQGYVRCEATAGDVSVKAECAASIMAPIWGYDGCREQREYSGFSGGLFDGIYYY